MEDLIELILEILAFICEAIGTKAGDNKKNTRKPITRP